MDEGGFGHGRSPCTSHTQHSQRASKGDTFHPKRRTRLSSQLSCVHLARAAT